MKHFQIFKSTHFQIIATLLFLSTHTFSQSSPTDFPELEFTNIPGAPRLSKPVLITGTKQPITSEGFGLAAPAFWDWDNDGTKDLLIGEFGTGIEHGEMVGNFIRVYKNIGTDSLPEYDGRWTYARPPFEILTTGTPYSVDQSCCIGFTPQFIDLNQDGKLDMITGQYYGEVSWLEATEAGFLPAQALQQEGDPRGTDHIKEQDYWLFTSASLGDFTNDGLPDIITGGTSLRISKNIGTKDQPRFARRELLLDTEGNPLSVYTYNEQDKKEFQPYADAFGWVLPKGGDEKLSPYVVDWDNDGVLDLLVTSSYTHEGLSVVDFFKGAVVKGEYRFHKPIPLFTAKPTLSGVEGKAFPGSGPRIFVTDYNNDGINDLLIGGSVAMVNEMFNAQLSWNWEKSEGVNSAGKTPGSNRRESDEDLQRKREQYKNKVPKGMTIDDYLTMRHQGCVYVMLGSPATTPAKAGSNNKKSTQKKGKRTN